MNHKNNSLSYFVQLPIFVFQVSVSMFSKLYLEMMTLKFKNGEELNLTYMTMKTKFNLQAINKKILMRSFLIGKIIFISILNIKKDIRKTINSFKLY